MMLEDLIAALEAEDPRKVLPDGFTNPHSWRGDYMQLAFEPAKNVTVAAMLADAKGALGRTFTGYKGGAYTMGDYTDCWLDHYGESDGETIGPRLLGYMLAAGHIPDADQVPACRVCGCTEEQACEGGCHWVEDPQMGELCSRCINAALKVSVVDLTDGETSVRSVPRGNYAVICSEPCHIADVQRDLVARTAVITLKDVRHG